MKKLKIYLDTSVISYLDQQDSPEKMNDTQKLWDVLKSSKYEVAISEIVSYEIEQCNNDKKQTLLFYIGKIRYENIELDEEIEELANRFVDNKILSANSIDDCRHIACSIVSGCDVIVSWNFKHIVNYKTIKGIKIIAALAGYKEIVICTPTMLLNVEI
jgi:predicted nucleic acid-binding protein